MLTHPRRLAAVERAQRILPGLPLRLDALARLAARLTGAPIGLICLVTPEEEIVVGEWGPTGTAGSGRGARQQQSVCAYVVSVGRPVAAADVSTDPELRGYPLHAGHGGRAFAGTPLRDTDGEPIGALAVIDTAVRAWSDRDVAGLGMLADLLADLLGGMPAGRTGPAAATLPELDSGELLTQLPVAFAAIDANGSIIGWNPASEKVFGWSAAEAIGQRLDRLILVEPDQRDFARLLAERKHAPPGQSQVTRGVARRRDGSEISYETITNVLSSPSGPIICGFMVDVSRRVSAEQTVDEQRLFLSAVLDSVLTMVTAVDATGTIVVVNRALRELLRLPHNWTQADLAPIWGWIRDLDGRPLPAEETPLMRAWSGEQVRGAQIAIRGTQWPERVFVVNAQPVVARDGRRLGAVAALHDVTDARRAEKFRACELDVVKALTYADDVGTAGRNVLAAIASTLGWPLGQLWLVDELAGLLRPAATWSRDEARFNLRRGPLAPGQGLAGSVWSGNEPRWIPDLADADDPDLAAAARRCGLSAALGLPIRGDDAVQGVLVLFSEAAEELSEQVVALLSAMTAHIGAYLARQYARGLAVELGRSRDDFLSLVGHAMRTPLTSIAAYTDLLLSQVTQEQDRQLLTVVARHANSLRRIIDDLLELAGLQSGHVVIERHPTDLVALVRTTVAGADPLARQNQVDFVTDLPAEVWVEGDQRRLARVLDNLLSNAVKYSPDGGTVRVRLHTVGEVVDLTVADSGVGVPADERERLFQRFFRARNAVERGIAGSGLGLTTARAIVEAHGGQISVASRPDDEPGTLVTVRLPRWDTTDRSRPAQRPGAGTLGNQDLDPS